MKNLSSPRHNHGHPDAVCPSRRCGCRREAARTGEDNLVRPFHVNVPEERLTDLRKRIVATRWPEKETVTDASQGVQLVDDAGTRALLGNRLRLAQVRGEAERPIRNS